MNNSDHYFVDGTEFEIMNCPIRMRHSGICESALSNAELKSNSKPGDKMCKNLTCPIKSHIVHLSALINVCNHFNSPALTGAKACFDDFIIKKN